MRKYLEVSVTPYYICRNKTKNYDRTKTNNEREDRAQTDYVCSPHLTRLLNE